MKLLYVDCYSGISGDMFLGALVDAGLPLDLLRQEFQKLHLAGLKDVQALEVKKGALRARLMELTIDSDEKNQPHRHLGDIAQVIRSSSLADPVQRTALRIFHRLAEAEAHVHGEEIHQVHFHEVGAVDSILDIVGAAVGLDYFGVDRVYSSPVPLGSGMVQTQHGLMPLPAPAVLELLQAVQAPLRSSTAEVELVTPTGAAILAELAVFEQPPMILKKCGTGAGRRDLPWPNILRILVGEAEPPYQETHVEIETNIDDMNPQFYGYVMERLFAAGALDVTVAPLMMKKNRPACRLSVIARKQDERALADVLLRETTTLGVRVIPLTRYEAEREIHPVMTPFGEVRVKLKKLDGVTVLAAPEYDACVDLARKTGRPLEDIYEAARRAAADLYIPGK